MAGLHQKKQKKACRQGPTDHVPEALLSGCWLIAVAVARALLPHLLPAGKGSRSARCAGGSRVPWLLMLLMLLLLLHVATGQFQLLLAVSVPGLDRLVKSLALLALKALRARKGKQRPAGGSSLSGALPLPSLDSWSGIAAC